MTRVIVVGSGAGGATVAKELQGPCEVTILEAGAKFQRLSLELSTMEMLKRTRLLLD
jgi:choline dehydrogenase-like flavoprotein